MLHAEILNAYPQKYPPDAKGVGLFFWKYVLFVLPLFLKIPLNSRKQYIQPSLIFLYKRLKIRE